MNYKNLLAEIHNASATSPTQLVIPSNTQLYTINLSERKINAPKAISVQTDHYADTVYFLVDRFYDSMDLAQTNCVVQYKTALGNFIYAVPFCDISTYNNKIIIPWSISAAATQNHGTIEFILRFYLIDPNTLNNEQGPQFSYSLSTLPATSEILKTLTSEEFQQESDILIEQPNLYQQLIDQVNTIMNNSAIYWIEANDLPNREGD